VLIEKHESVPIGSDDDVVRVRQKVRDWAISLGFTLVDQTKLVTAAASGSRSKTTGPAFPTWRSR
jgi:serine/threonine-protein kinase RsbT